METAVDQVQKYLRLLVDLMKKSEEAKSKLLTWIDKYDGKIIEFHVDNSAFHIVFSKEDVKFEEGSYPSPDVIMITEPNVLMDVLSGKIRLSSSLIAEGKFRVWGNFHELVLFTRIASSLRRTVET